MAITAAQQQSIIKLVGGMFNAPPGGYMSELADYIDAGGTIAQLAEVLTQTTAFKSASFYPTFLTSNQFAVKFIDNLMGSGTTNVTQANKDLAVAYVESQIDAGVSRGAVMNTVINALDAASSSLDVNNAAYGTAAALFDNRVEVASYYTITKLGTATDVGALQNTISSVTSNTASVTVAKASIDDNVDSAQSRTVTLTISPDTVGTAASIASAMQVGSVNDTIIGYVSNSAAADNSATTLSVADQLAGGEGTDTLQVTLGNTAALAPSMSSIEVVSLRAVSPETAMFSLANAGTAVTAVEISGTSDINIAGLPNAERLVFSGGYTNTATLAIRTDTTADSVTLVVGDASSAGLRDGAASTATGIEVVNLVASAAFRNDQVFDFQRATALNISGTANVTLSLQTSSGSFVGFTASGLASGNMVGMLGNINASALQGNLSLVLSTAAIDQIIVGGAGNDTFFASGGFNQSDSLDAGAGTDTLNLTLAASGTNRPVVQGVESLFVDFDADGTIDLRNASAASITTLSVLGAATSTFCALNSATNTLNIYSGAGAAGGITFGYTSGAASDVTLNLSNQATATSTAGYNMGDLAMTNNTGALTINVVGSATGVGVDAVNLSNSTLTINVNSGDLTGLSAIAATAAKTVTINVNNGKEFSSISGAAFTAASAVAINLSGSTSARAVMSSLSLASAALSLNVGSGASAVLSIGAIAFGGTAANGSIIVTNGGDGDVALSAITLGGTALGTTATAGSVSLSVIQAGTGASFVASAIAFADVGTAAWNFTLAGQGTFELTEVGAGSAGTAQVILNATAITTGAVTANFTAVTDTNITFDVRLGAHSATVALGAANDTVQFGLNNQQSVRGGAGNDELTMNNTAASVAQYNMATANEDSGVDTVFGAQTGDIILFQNFVTAVSANTGALGTGSGFAGNTGTTWVYGTAAAATAIVATATLTARADQEQFIAMFTAAGDMIIQVVIGSATAGATTTANVQQIVLNGKGDIGPTALLRIDTNGSGLLLTLL